MVQDNVLVFTYVLGFVQKNNVLMQKNSLVAGLARNFKQVQTWYCGCNDLLTRLVTLSNPPLRKRYNVFAEGCWLGFKCRQPWSWKKTGPIEEQAILSLQLSSSFAVRWFCALSACFMHVFSLLELLTVAVQSMFLDSVGVTRVWN